MPGNPSAPGTIVFASHNGSDVKKTEVNTLPCRALGHIVVVVSFLNDLDLRFRPNIFMALELNPR